MIWYKIMGSPLNAFLPGAIFTRHGTYFCVLHILDPYCIQAAHGMTGQPVLMSACQSRVLLKQIYTRGFLFYIHQDLQFVVWFSTRVASAADKPAARPRHLFQHLSGARVVISLPCCHSAERNVCLCVLVYACACVYFPVEAD